MNKELKEMLQHILDILERIETKLSSDDNEALIKGICQGIQSAVLTKSDTFLKESSNIEKLPEDGGK